MTEQIILVDKSDQQIGIAEKIEAHKKGLLHRAFSVYIFNNRGELMLQKRAEGKYHCGGLWTNTACGHPRDGEDISDAAHRRLFEEMGINTDLQKITSFIYHIPFDNGLEEHEYLHVFTGICDEAPVLNPQEADDWKWMSLPDLKTELEEHPEQYTYWMRITIPKIEAFLLAQRSDRE